MEEGQDRGGSATSLPALRGKDAYSQSSTAQREAKVQGVKSTFLGRGFRDNIKQGPRTSSRPLFYIVMRFPLRC